MGYPNTNVDLFRLVSDMNIAFGNPKGDPKRINGEKLLSQCKNLGKEYQELMAAFGIEIEITYKPRDPGHNVNVGDIRDALCDMNVFSLGAHHIMGYDANIDMELTVEAVMTRFCSTPEVLMETCKKYDAEGVEYYIEGQFPRVCLKSARDQGAGEYLKGKFLKAVGYRTPVFLD